MRKLNRIAGAAAVFVVADAVRATVGTVTNCGPGMRPDDTMFTVTVTGVQFEA